MNIPFKAYGKELVRIAGEAEFLALHDGDKVVKAYFISRAPVRGFESLVVGKNPIFVVEAVMRICGVCHAAHGIASAEAFEHALGLLPSRHGLLLREAIGLVNRLQSHILHTILISQDILRPELQGKMVRMLLSLLEKVNSIMLKLGSAVTHPPAIVIGGISRPPTEASFKEAQRILVEVAKSVSELRDSVLNEDNMNEHIKVLKKIRAPENFIASHLFYGDRYNISLDKVTVKHYSEYKPMEDDVDREVAKKTTTLIALYDGKKVEVGPRARLSIYRGFNAKSLFDVQVARIKEIELITFRLSELMDIIDISAPLRSGQIVFREGEGVGVYEAPRGLLIHKVALDNEGRVRKYRIITPTMFNVPIIESTSLGVPISIVEVIPRLYDPCIPCTTHLIKLK